MKKLAKNIVAVVLGYQVRKLCKKNNLKVVAVTGSIGKTSTKLAAAKVLSAGFKVQSQDGNYNDLVSVPLVFFGEKMPSLYNPLAWLAVFWRNQKQLAKPYAYDIVVVELGSDRPGDIRQFGKYLRVEIAIVTAIAPEHMQNFTSLDDVAAEELAVKDYASLVMANQDLCADKYLKTVPQLLTYGLRKPADYGPLIIKGAKAKSEAEQYSLMAAAAVAEKLGIKAADIQKSLAGVKAAPGR
ncbi:MAG TPA: Mur ligase family protein, partial [Candidatus Saccharimonadales bacterium]|nr:Mur ligase family protein [Candidatus Saccharimonadales bacterium]